MSEQNRDKMFEVVVGERQDAEIDELDLEKIPSTPQKTQHEKKSNRSTMKRDATQEKVPEQSNKGSIATTAKITKEPAVQGIKPAPAAMTQKVRPTAFVETTFRLHHVCRVQMLPMCCSSVIRSSEWRDTYWMCAHVHCCVCFCVGGDRGRREAQRHAGGRRCRNKHSRRTR